MPSVIIAAHNEEAVINTTLESLTREQSVSRLEIVVVANGCTDATASVARRPGVRVIDRPEPGKAAALNAGDSIASEYPRIYLDADITVPPGGLAKLVQRLDGAVGDGSPHTMAVVPQRRVQTKGRPPLVRAYTSISESLPAFRAGLFGRGLIVLSREGRQRCDCFPRLIADDLFLDSLFSEDEKAEVADVVVSVEAPFTSRDLLRRLVRVRRGNLEMRAASASGQISVPVRQSARWAWLKDVIMQEPRLAPAAVPYVGFTIVAALLARRGATAAGGWGRDESTRSRPEPVAHPEG